MQEPAARLRLLAPLIRWQEELSTRLIGQDLKQQWYVAGELNTNGETCSTSAYRNYSTVKRRTPKPSQPSLRSVAPKKRRPSQKPKLSRSAIPAHDTTELKLPSLQQLRQVIHRDFVVKYKDAATAINTPSTTLPQSQHTSKQKLIKRKYGHRPQRFHTEPIPGARMPCAWNGQYEPGMEDLLEME